MSDRRQTYQPVAVERRKVGRPKATEPSAAVCAWLPASEHDRIIAIAYQRRQSVSSLVRELLQLAVESSAS